jgi:Tat protein translocase TatB subunit
MSFEELAVLLVVGLVVLGPVDLQRLARQVGRWVGNARRTANRLRYQLEREIEGKGQ